MDDDQAVGDTDGVLERGRGQRAELGDLDEVLVGGLDEALGAMSSD